MKKRLKRFIMCFLIYLTVCTSFTSEPLAGREVDELLKNLNGEKAAKIKELDAEEAEDENGEWTEKE